MLARHADEPVFVAAGRVFAATFHPELGDSPTVHQLFVDSVSAGIPEAVAVAAASGS